MSRRIANSRGNRTKTEFAGADLRAGMAKERLIFIIICSVAMAVAVVTLVHFFTGDSKKPTGEWQCLKCAYEFSKKTTEMPPIDCPKCGNQAVRATYRVCPECKKKVSVSRARLTEQGQAQREQAKSAAGQQGGPGLGFGMLRPPVEIQYWFKQADGSYGWSPWILRTSAQAQQFSRTLQCPECGASLYPPRSSKSKR